MKKIVESLFIFVLFIFGIMLPVEAIDTAQNQIINDMYIQNKVSDIGLKLLNANKIDVRMIFVYESKNSKINLEPGLTKRQIIAYEKSLQFASNDDEIAAFLAREICKTAESYSGIWKGIVASVQVKCAPKKFEIFFDKRAVDFMVNAGFNPLGLITYINKSYPQKRYDKFARTNLTSKRLANIYEYIYTKYPIYLKNNEYIQNEAYQNFLLTSASNRKKLYDKVKSGSKKAVDYD